MVSAYFYFLSFPTLQRYKNNADEKKIYNIFFFRQHILCCQCKNKFSPFWVYSKWDKLNLYTNKRLVNDTTHQYLPNKTNQLTLFNAAVSI